MRPVSHFVRPALLVACLLFTFSFTYAQGQSRAGSSAARRELRAYREENILPAVRQQRTRLEAQLAEPDKAQLATYRNQLQALRQQEHELRRSFRQSSPASATPNAPQLSTAQKEQLRALRTSRRAILTQVQPLAQKYSAAIEPLLAELQPRQIQWQADLQSIRAKYAADASAAPHGGHRHLDGQKMLKPAHFLLLSADAPAPRSRQADRTSDVFPNPVTSASQLSYEVKKSGPVTIELLDARGTAQRTLLNEKQEKGTHSISTGTENLAPGTYFLKITTRSGVETKRFVKQ